jgi:hypothetical protein
MAAGPPPEKIGLQEAPDRKSAYQENHQEGDENRTQPWHML